MVHRTGLSFEAEQRYHDDTAVLTTTLTTPDAVVELTDFFAMRSGADLTEIVPSGRGQLVRIARVISGSVDLDIRFSPSG